MQKDTTASQSPPTVHPGGIPKESAPLPKRIPKTETKRPPEPEKPKEVERVYRGDRRITHDLFKLSVAKLLKNESWVYRAPRLIPMEHTHIYHSIDEKTGKTNQYCSPIGGHFHKVTVDWTKKSLTGDGPLVHVGPALQKKLVRVPGARNKKTRVVPVKFLQWDEKNDEDRWVPDSHNHVALYIDSEEITMGMRDKRREDERNKVRQAMDRSYVSTQPMRQAAVGANASKAPPTAPAPPREDGTANAGE